MRSPPTAGRIASAGSAGDLDRAGRPDEARHHLVHEQPESSGSTGSCSVNPSTTPLSHHSTRSAATSSGVPITRRCPLPLVHSARLRLRLRDDGNETGNETDRLCIAAMGRRPLTRVAGVVARRSDRQEWRVDQVGVPAGEVDALPGTACLGDEGVPLRSGNASRPKFAATSGLKLVTAFHTTRPPLMWSSVASRRA